MMPRDKKVSNQTASMISVRWGGWSEAHQSAGDAHHSDGGLGRLRDVEQVVEQRLVLVVGEQIKLIQDEQHRAAAAAITWRKEAGGLKCRQFNPKGSISVAFSYLSSMPPARKTDSQRNFPGIKKQVFRAAFLALLMAKYGYNSIQILTNTLSPTTFSRWSCRVISWSAILSSVCRRPSAKRGEMYLVMCTRRHF